MRGRSGAVGKMGADDGMEWEIVAEVAGAVDWVSRFADEVIAEAERRAPGKPVVCASGLSPSGPVHLGNLREVMTPHLVADEIRRRGVEVEHLISWDDYDRFRKVPAGIDPSWAEHIGKPLTAVPAPPGSRFPNWAEHFKAAMIDSLAELGVEYRGISQTEMYTSGAYRDQVLLAMRERNKIDEILDRYRTKGRPAGAPAKNGKQGPKMDEADAAAAAEAAEGSGAADEDDGGAGAGYYPYKPYCAQCGKDFTTVTSYDDATTAMTYVCQQDGFTETVTLSEFHRGKLVWKVDWPMRWAYEFGGTQPIGPMYAFVGISGQAKMSSSRGGAPTPGDALEIMEAPLLRWMYARRRPNQSFKIAFDAEIQRMYDEWDALTAKIAAGTAPPADAAAHDRAVRTAGRALPQTPLPVAYRTLASIADITTGNDEQTLRILADLDPERPVTDLAQVRPRLAKAQTWVLTQLAPEARTQVRTEPDKDLLATLDDTQRESLRLLAAGLDANWSLDGLSTLVYGVPKTMAGLPPDTKPTQELKVAQRAFFVLLYRLLIGKETGPRLPTLLLAVGADRLRTLIGA